MSLPKIDLRTQSRTSFITVWFGCLLIALLRLNEVQAGDAPPDGLWQHPKDPVWIDMSVAAGTGVAVRNDDQPDTVGFHVVRGLAQGDKADVWKGEVYVPQLESYKNVSINLPDEQTLRMTVKFGFIRRSVDWSRVETIEGVTSP